MSVFNYRLTITVNYRLPITDSYRLSITDSFLITNHSLSLSLQYLSFLIANLYDKLVFSGGQSPSALPILSPISYAFAREIPAHLAFSPWSPECSTILAQLLILFLFNTSIANRYKKHLFC